MNRHLLCRIRPSTAPAAAMVMLFLSAVAAGPAQAALDPAVAAILERAAARDAKAGGIEYLKTAAILAIDAAPEAAAEVWATVKTLGPDGAAAVIAAVRAVDPAVAPNAPEPTSDTPDKAGPGGGAKRSPFARLGLSGDLALGGSVSAGNTDETAANAALSLTREGTRWKHRFKANFDWTRTGGATTKQRLVADYQADYTYSDRAFVFGYLQYEDEKFSGFDFRTSQSVGLGYRFLDSRRLRLSAQIGPALRQDKLLPAGIIETEFGGRASTRLEWAINDWSRLENDISVLVGTQRSTFETKAALKLKFTEVFNVRLSYALQWDSNVPPDKVNTDTITRLSLVYGF